MAPTDTIAATALQARKGVIAHFSGHQATTPEAALTYQPQRHAERRALSYLMARGVMHLTEDGRYWLDTLAADEWRRENRTRAAWMVGGAAAAVAGLAVWRELRKRR